MWIFYTIDREYEYEIHATTGAVLSYETGLIGSARRTAPAVFR